MEERRNEKREREKEKKAHTVRFTFVIETKKHSLL